MQATTLARLVKRSIEASPTTKRFCTACFVTPMLAPIAVQEAPDRRAWSTITRRGRAGQSRVYCTMPRHISSDVPSPQVT